MLIKCKLTVYVVSVVETDKNERKCNNLKHMPIKLLKRQKISTFSNPLISNWTKDSKMIYGSAFSPHLSLTSAK